MIIVNQWRNKAIILRNVFEISIDEVTEFEVTQTRNVSKQDIGGFMIRVIYITPYMMRKFILLSNSRRNRSICR